MTKQDEKMKDSKIEIKLVKVPGPDPGSYKIDGIGIKVENMNPFEAIGLLEIAIDQLKFKQTEPMIAKELNDMIPKETPQQKKDRKNYIG